MKGTGTNGKKTNYFFSFFFSPEVTSQNINKVSTYLSVYFTLLFEITEGYMQPFLATAASMETFEHQPIVLSLNHMLP